MALAITSFTPSSADSSGGTLITLTGTQLTDAEAFMVGTKAAQIVGAVTSTSATIRVPGQTPGAVKIYAVDESGSVIAPSATNLTIVGTVNTKGSLTGAAKWAYQVDTSVAQDGSAWASCRALTNLQTPLEQTTQDTSSYEDYDPITGLSWKSQAPTQLGWSLVATFDRFKYSGVYDPAQEVLRAAAESGGDASVVHVRWYDRTGGPEAYEGFGTVSWSENGGATADKSTVQSTVMGKGARIAISNPAAA